MYIDNIETIDSFLFKKYWFLIFFYLFLRDNYLLEKINLEVSSVIKIFFFTFTRTGFIFIELFRHICDAIWETVCKVRKFNFKIFMTSHGGKNEEYSEKKIVSKTQFYAKVWRSKIMVAKS